ncbi:MAG: 5'/3'-nucleotidase SurE [Anaerolineales bacterium]|nr:5'/3'-nucleotidase SurE [Anaerolineales bacterium]
MHILVTNDDGIAAPGLLALAEEMRQIANTSILAPDRNWSGGGHVKTLDRPLRIREVQLMDSVQGFASDGAPSDCVALALLGFIPEKIDLVVSGINPNANLGHDVTYSGTVTAAMEAVIWGIPAIAFSLDTEENHLGKLDYAPAAHIARKIVQTVSKHRLPAGILLNVNIPYRPLAEIKGVQITRQGLRVYRDRLDQRIDPRGRAYFWIGGDAPTGIPEKGTDFGALADGFVSITPLQLDLTAYPALHLLNTWNWDGAEALPEDSPWRDEYSPVDSKTR